MEKEEIKQEVVLAKVVTQEEFGYKLPDGTIVSLPEYLIWLGNLVLQIKKSVV